MSRQAILVTAADMFRLRGLLAAQHPDDDRDLEHISALRAGLSAASIVEPGELPPDVATIHSRVALRDLERGTLATYTIVPPAEADASAGRLSVLAPLGTALLGRRAGDEIVFQSPAGERRLCLEQVVYQPEAAHRHQRIGEAAEGAAAAAG